MEAIILSKDFNQGLSTIHSRCPHKHHQRYHGIQRELVNLNFKTMEHFDDKSMHRQAKANSEECFKNN
jgi:hypothetical protein